MSATEVWCLVTILWFHLASPFTFTTTAAESVCVVAEKCPEIVKALGEGGSVTDFEQCGEEKYNCPCRCTSLLECQPFLQLALDKKFSELKAMKSCGFAGTVRKYCCPTLSEKKQVQQVRIDAEPNEDTTDISTTIGTTRLDSPEDENGRREFFATLRQECGSTFGVRITGGDKAGAHEYPWATALTYKNVAGDRRYLCGGALISSNVVLTAGHCVTSARGFNLTNVHIGHANNSHPEAVDVDIELALVHPDFGTDIALINDLALLKLSRPVDEGSSTIKPVCLPDRLEETREEEEARLEKGNIEVAGWGATEFAAMSEVLLRLDLFLRPFDKCEKDFQAHVPDFSLRDTQICANGLPGKDSCRGDSGGPLLHLDPEGVKLRTEVIGITSFGTIRCDSSVPGVYTRVSRYLDWIQDFVFEHRVQR